MKIIGQFTHKVSVRVSGKWQAIIFRFSRPLHSTFFTFLLSSSYGRRLILIGALHTDVTRNSLSGTLPGPQKIKIFFFFYLNIVHDFYVFEIALWLNICLLNMNIIYCFLGLIATFWDICNFVIGLLSFVHCHKADRRPVKWWHSWQVKVKFRP